jgi:hypothetical protein
MTGNDPDNTGPVAQRRVRRAGSEMRIRTNRIGPLSIRATAPVLEGTLSDTDIEFTVSIDHVDTGNPLLDPELHALIRQITSGTLVFRGRKSGDTFSGSASAGNITIPLDLKAGGEDAAAVDLQGRSRFSDVHVPLPGLGHIRHLEVDIDGRLHLE